MLTRIEKQLPVELSEYIFTNFVQINRNFEYALEQLEENTLLRKIYFDLIYTSGRGDENTFNNSNYYDQSNLNFTVIVKKVDKICKNLKNMKVELRKLKKFKQYKKIDNSYEYTSHEYTSHEYTSQENVFDCLEEIELENTYKMELEMFTNEYKNEVEYSKKSILHILHLLCKHNLQFKDAIIQYLLKSYVYVSRL